MSERITNITFGYNCDHKFLESRYKKSLLIWSMFSKYSSFRDMASTLPIETYALLGLYTPQKGSSVLTFQDNLSVPSSRVKKSKNNDIHQYFPYISISQTFCSQTPLGFEKYPRIHTSLLTQITTHVQTWTFIMLDSYRYISLAEVKMHCIILPYYNDCCSLHGYRKFLNLKF